MKLTKCYIIIIVLTLIVGILSKRSTRKTTRNNGTKAFGETCSPKTIGSECQKGLKCHEFVEVCLKDSGADCDKNRDCYSEMCQKNKCLSKLKADLIRTKKRTIDNLWSWE